MNFRRNASSGRYTRPILLTCSIISGCFNSVWMIIYRGILSEVIWQIEASSSPINQFISCGWFRWSHSSQWILANTILACSDTKQFHRILVSIGSVTLQIIVHTIQSAFFGVPQVRENLKTVNYKASVGFKTTNPFQKCLKASFIRRWGAVRGKGLRYKVLVKVHVNWKANWKWRQLLRSSTEYELCLGTGY